METTPFSLSDLFLGYEAELSYIPTTSSHTLKTNPILSRFLVLLNFLSMLPNKSGEIVIMNYGPVHGIIQLARMFEHFTFIVLDPKRSSMEKVGNVVLINKSLDQIETIDSFKPDTPLTAIISFFPDPKLLQNCTNNKNLIEWFWSIPTVYHQTQHFLLPVNPLSGCTDLPLLPKGHILKLPFDTTNQALLWVDRLPGQGKISTIEWDFNWLAKQLELSLQQQRYRSFSIDLPVKVDYPGLGSDYDSTYLVWSLKSYLRKTNTDIGMIQRLFILIMDKLKIKSI